jgi:hypothetical protein
MCMIGNHDAYIRHADATHCLLMTHVNSDLAEI